MQWLEGGGAQDGMPRDAKRSVINLTMTDGGFSAVRREANPGTLGFRPDLEVEGSVEEATVDGKPGVSDEIDRSTPIRFSRARSGEVAELVAQRPGRQELGGTEKTLIVGFLVQRVDRKHVRSGEQFRAKCGEVDALSHNSLVTAVAYRGCRVPAKSLGGVGARHLDAVEISDESIVVFHAQGQRFNACGIFHLERDPEVQG